MECLGIPEAKFSRTIAHDEALAILGQSPTLTGIAELAPGIKSVQIVDETSLGLPGNLEQPVFRIDDAFSKVLLPDVTLLEDLASIKLDLANRRAPMQACSLVQHSGQIEQDLRVG